jgi:hypothetical protein
LKVDALGEAMSSILFARATLLAFVASSLPAHSSNEHLYLGFSAESILGSCVADRNDVSLGFCHGFIYAIAYDTSIKGMVALSHMFQRWAIDEENIEPENRTELIQWSADLERLAGWVGESWRAVAPSSEMPLVKFIAIQERRSQ